MTWPRSFSLCGRTSLIIDGTEYHLKPKEAALAEILLENVGNTVPMERLTQRLGTTRAVVWTSAHYLRKIFEQHGYLLLSEFGVGYCLKC